MSVAKVVLELLSAVASFVAAKGDEAAEEEAMLEAEEALKRERDRRKFAGR